MNLEVYQKEYLAMRRLTVTRPARRDSRSSSSKFLMGKVFSPIAAAVFLARNHLTNNGHVYHWPGWPHHAPLLSRPPTDSIIVPSSLDSTIRGARLAAYRTWLKVAPHFSLKVCCHRGADVFNRHTHKSKVAVCLFVHTSTVFEWTANVWNLIAMQAQRSLTAVHQMHQNSYLLHRWSGIQIRAFWSISRRIVFKIICLSADSLNIKKNFSF